MTTVSGSADESGQFASNLEAPPGRPILTLVAATALAAAAIVGPRLVPRQILATFVETSVCPGLGIECRVSGPIHARLLPYPTIEAKGLTLAIPERKASISAARIVAELRALPLLVGRIGVNHLHLAEAEIEISAPPGAMQLFAAADGMGATAVDAVIAADRQGNRLTRVSLDRSKLVIHSDSGRRSITVDAVSGVASWPQGGGDLFVRLAGVLSGEAVSLRVEGPDLANLTRTGGSPVIANAIFGENLLSYRGRLVKTPDLVAAGTLEAILPSAKRMVRQFRNLRWPLWLPDQALYIAGQAFVTSRGIDFENAEFKVGRTRFAGGMSLRMTEDGRPALSGTIAAPLIELGNLSVPHPGQVTLPSFDRLPDLDLRMSARRVLINGTSIDAVAAGLILAERRLDLTLSQGVPGEASAKFRIVATPDEEWVAIKAQASAENIAVGSILSGLSLRPALSGTGSFSMALDGRGGDLAALERSLAGKATLQIKKGALSLGAEGEPVASIGAGDVPGDAPIPAASRRFSEASFAGVAEHGVLTLTEGRIGEGPSQIAVGGKIDLTDRSVDLSLVGAAEAPGDASWAVRATGSWSTPILARQQPATR